MDKLYFKSLNGYYVKDENAEKILNDKAYFIFPKFTGNELSGDGNLIKYGDINIVIDTNGSFNWNSFKSLLDDNNVTNIDYLIISHYDGDHVGNIDNLIANNYINNDTSVFLPIVPDNFSSMQTVETNVKTSLTNANISFRTPTEKETITIGESLKITFGNLNKNYMEANYTEYNATSMVCLINHKDIQAFYSGDAFYQTYKYLYDINFITRTIDLYKQPHHGIDMLMPFILLDEIMSPIHTVQCGGINDFVKNNFYSAETSFLINKGTLYYPSYMQTDYINFISNGKDLNCLSGKTASFSGQMNTLNIYVDINASVSAIQDGTQEHPFSELMQAIGFIKNFPSGIYTIYLADGNYGYSHEVLTHEKNSIQLLPDNNIIINIRGNHNDRTKVVLNGLRCYNTNVKLFDLTVDNKIRDGILVQNTALYGDNILITSSDDTQSGHTGIIAEYGSRIRVVNSKIEYCNKCVRITSGSYYSYDNNEYKNYTQQAVNVEDAKACYKNIKASGDGNTVLLTDDYKNYDWIEIQYKTSDNFRNSVRIANPSDGLKISANLPYTSVSGETYDKKALFNLQNGERITITNMYQTTIINGNVTVSALNEGAFVILGVYGGYNG